MLKGSVDALTGGNTGCFKRVREKQKQTVQPVRKQGRRGNIPPKKHFQADHSYNRV